MDLVVVSVLLDAGAGNTWKYTEEQSGQTFSRSEGLAVASVHMFQSGLFSSDSQQPYRVDGRLSLYKIRDLRFSYNFQAKGLENITSEKTAIAMQVSESNPMVGIEGRTSLLFNLGKALKANSQFFGIDGRPGNIVGTHAKCPHFA